MATFGRSEGLQYEVTGKEVNNCWKLSNIQFSLFLKRSLSVSCDLYTHGSLNSHLPNDVCSELRELGGLPRPPTQVSERMRSALPRGFYRAVLHGLGPCSCVRCEPRALCVVSPKRLEERLALGKRPSICCRNE